MPARPELVPAGTCAGVYFVAVDVVSSDRRVARHCVVVLYDNLELVVSNLCKVCCVKLKRSEKALVSADKFSVEENLGYVVDPLEGKNHSFAGEIRNVECGFIAGSVLSDRSPVIGNSDVSFLSAVEREFKILKLDSFDLLVDRRSIVFKKWLIFLTESFKLLCHFLFGVHFFKRSEALCFVRVQSDILFFELRRCVLYKSAFFFFDVIAYSYIGKSISCHLKYPFLDTCFRNKS